MKRLLFPAFVAAAVAGGLLALAACDPDLGVVTTPGEAGAKETSTADAPVAPSSEAGPTTEGGTDDGGTEAGPTAHVIDGTNDFTAGEKLATSSPGYDAYVSWDDKKIYFGMSGSDIGTTATNKWVFLYLDGVPAGSGSPTGIAYDCGGTCAPGQQAHLPFNAGYHVRWKVDGSYSNLQKWSGSAWSDVGPISTFARTGTFWEISLTRALLGSPAKLKVSMNMLIEAADPPGWTYAGVPSTSFTDGYAPANFSKYFEFDLADQAKAPSAYAPKP
jgi:hypothetical protein